MGSRATKLFYPIALKVPKAWFSSWTGICRDIKPPLWAQGHTLGRTVLQAQDRGPVGDRCLSRLRVQFPEQFWRRVRKLLCGLPVPPIHICLSLWHPSPAPYVFNCYLSRPIKGTAWLTLLSQSPGQVKVLPHTYSQRNERSQLIVIIIQAPLPELGFGHTPVWLAKRPTARRVVIFSWPGWPGHGGKSLSTLCCSSPRRGTSWTEPRRGWGRS